MKFITLLILLSLNFLSLSQSKLKIDSINNIDFSVLISDLELNKVKFKKNINDALKIKYKAGAVKAKVKLSIILFYLKEVDKGLAYSIEATNYYKSVEDWPNVANCYTDIGYLFKETNLPLALNYFRKALKLSKTHDIGVHKEKLFNNYGVLQMLKTPKEMDSAIYYHTKAFEIAKELNLTVSIPYSLNNLVTVYSAKQNFDKAFYYLDLSDNYRKSDTLSIDWADNLAYRADVYFDKKNFKIASTYYKKSLVLAQKNSFVNLVKYCYEKLSASNEKIGNTKDALFYMKAYQNYKDSIGTLETNLAIAKMQEKFDVAQKEQQILKQEAKIIGQKNKILWLVIGLFIFLVLGFSIYRSIKQKQQKLKQQLILGEIQADKKIQHEKLRISRDLHDNIGSQLTYVISSLDNLNYIKDENKRMERLADLEKFTKNTLTELRETIWTVNAKSITLSEMYLKLSEYMNRINESLNNISVQIENKHYHKDFIINNELAINCFRSIQEAVNNAVKYSEASEINILFKNKSIYVNDNGSGFDISKIKNGNGLNNIKSRMTSAKSKVEIKSIVNRGTQIVLTFY